MDSMNLFEPKLPLVARVSVHGLTILLLLLYGFSHLLYGSLLLGILCFIALVFAALSLFTAINRNSSSIFLMCFVTSLALILLTASYLYGERGLVYCFSFAAALFFMLSFRAALAGGLTICCLSVAAASHIMPGEMLLRFGIALGFSFMLSATFASQILKQTAKLERDANQDYLTGLMNQRRFYGWLEGLLSDPSNLHSKLTLFYFDIDDFKSVNDGFGHEGGDRVLKEFAERIKNCARDINIEFHASPELNFCRLSGDEFVLACVNTDSRDTATYVASRFQEILSKPFFIGERRLQIRSSIGVNHIQVENQDVGYVMRSADLAMYEAKKSGKQQFHIYEDSPEPHVYRDQAF